jgi:hypothetical protein
VEEEILISPNPFSTWFEVRPGDTRYTTGDLMLADMHGRVVMQYEDIPLPAIIHTNDLPAGIYLCVISKAGRTVASEKLMKN